MTTVSQLLREMDENAAKARAIVHGLSHEQFNWRREPGRWSIAQCLTHLNVVNGQEVAPIAEAVRNARARGIEGPPPYRCGPISRRFVGSMEPPVGSRRKAPESYQPPQEADPESALHDYLRIAGEVRALAVSSEGIDLGRAKTILPVLPAALRAIVRMPLAARFAVIAAHDRRHLWQAEQVRMDADFPG